VAFIHGNQPVEAGCLLHIGGGDDDAHAGVTLADLVDQVPELAARERVDTGGGVVQDQEVGIMNQCAAKAQLLLHSAGELAGWPVRERSKPSALEELVDPLFARAPVVAEETAEEIDIFENG
jgi:hypothetical protein